MLGDNICRNKRAGYASHEKLGGFYQCNNHTQFKSDKKCREKQFAVLHFCTPVTFKCGRHTGMNGQNSAEIVIVHSLKDRHPRKGQPSCFC